MPGFDLTAHNIDKKKSVKIIVLALIFKL
jgi:hypothetical protein